MLFGGIKRSDILFRSNNLLSEIWKNLEYSNLNDKKIDFEIMRQIINSDITKIAFGNLFISPVESIFQTKSIVIDIGCGSMTWFYDILCECKQHKIDIESLLIGIDITDFFSRVDDNSNCLIKKLKKISYEPCIILDNYNVNNGLRCNKETVDFVYQRDMISIYKIDQWENIINYMHNILKDNGYAELIEYDINIKTEVHPKNNKFSDIFNNSLIKIFRNNNNEINVDNIYKKITNKFGFKNVKRIKRKIPLYDEKIFNKIVIENMKIGYQYFKQPFMEILKLEDMNFLESEGVINSPDKTIDFNKVIKKIIKEWEENKCYMELYCISAQKVKIEF